MLSSRAEIGIIGGTGVYDQDILENVKEVNIHTPYGQTSSLITVGSYQGRTIAFIPRHGKHHQFPPHNIPFRANIWALKQLGVTRIISPSAVGSLREDYRPSEFVIIDQFIDRTKNRGDTFYDGGQICHISTAEPFCPELRAIFASSSKILQLPFHDRGTYVWPRLLNKIDSIAGSDVFEYNLEFRKPLHQWRQYALNEDLLSVEHINTAVGDFAMNQ